MCGGDATNWDANRERERDVQTRTVLEQLGERREVPANIRRHLSGRLRKLAAKGKLEKIPNKNLKTEAVSTTMPPFNQTDVSSAHLQGIDSNKPACDMADKSADPMIPSEAAMEITYEIVEAAAADAASEVAKSEIEEFLAAQAVEEKERVEQMAVETDQNLQLAMEIFEKCARGEVVHVEWP